MVSRSCKKFANVEYVFQHAQVARDNTIIVQKTAIKQ